MNSEENENSNLNVYFPRHINTIVTIRQTFHTRNFVIVILNLHVSAARDSHHQASRFRNIKKEIT
jgi:hypothetical protein